MTNEADVEERLEAVDIEVRAPSIVLSVRLDEPTGRRLHALARQRGVRMSDLLREAATAYAASPPQTGSWPYTIEFAGTRVAIGTIAVNSQGAPRPEVSQELVAPASGWGLGVTTKAASAGSR